MSSEYNKGVFVMDYLQSIGLDMITIGSAVDDENLQKSYDLIKSNPTITKYEFVQQLGIDYDEEEIVLWDFLHRMKLGCCYIAEALDDDNYDKTINICKTRPDITREEFISVMQLTGKYKDMC